MPQQPKQKKFTTHELPEGERRSIQCGLDYSAAIVSEALTEGPFVLKWRRFVLRAKFLVDAKGLNKVSGQPFKIREITDGIKALMGDQA